MKNNLHSILTILFCSFSFSTSAQYCTPSGAFSACALGLNDFWITDASFTGVGSTFSFTGGVCVSTAPFYLNTGYQGDVVEGNTYTLSITKAGNTYKTYFNVWVDWNNNNILSDATPFVENIASNLLLTAGGGVSATSSITIPMGVSPGVYRMRIRVQYNVTNANNPCLTTGQAESKDFNLNVISSCTPPVVVAGVSNANICEGDVIVFTGSGALTYQWNNGVVDGTPFSPLGTNTYIVIGTDANGCTDTASVTVNVTSLPVYTLSVSDDTICSGASVTGIATGSAGISYNWIPGGIIGDTVILSPTTSTNYSCIGVQAGCITSIPISVTVLALPTQPVINQSGGTLSTTSVALAYQWFLDGDLIGGATNNSYEAGQQTGNYTVLITDANGCQNESSQYNYLGDGILAVQNFSSVVCTNPFADFISVQKLKGENEIEIINVQGEVLLRIFSRNENELLNTSVLASGIYLLKIKSVSSIMNKVVVKN